MKSKKIRLKILFTIMVMFIMIFIYNSQIYAIDSIISSADNFMDLPSTSILNEKSIKDVSDILFNVFFAIGSAIVIIVGVILGLKFIMGSTTEKAEVKETLVPYVVGAVVIFASITIWTLVANVLTGVF